MVEVKERPYQGAEDDWLVRELLSRSFAVSGHPYYSVDPPNWERFRAAASLGTSGQVGWLWVEQGSGCLAGLALYQQDHCTFSYLVDPQRRDIADQFVAWAEDRHLTAECGQVQQRFLRCSVCENNAAQKEVLRRRGYGRENMGTLFRKRELNGQIERLVLPEGYVLHEVGALSEEMFAARAAAESVVFGGKITADFLRLLQESPIYRPELDLLITGSDGSVAAFCTLWFDAQHQVGFVEPVGTVDAYRQLGLGKAVMLEGFRRLKMMGGTAVYLGHRFDNNAANHLYEAVGMPVFDREYLWGKRI